MPALVDISVPLRSGIAADPPGMGPRIEYLGHHDTVADMRGMFPGAGPEVLPDGEGWAIEKIWLTTHRGTHMDAPYHYASTMDNGQRAITIDGQTLRRGRLPGPGLRHGARRHPAPAPPGRPGHRHGLVEMGRAFHLHGPAGTPRPATAATAVRSALNIGDELTGGSCHENPGVPKLVFWHAGRRNYAPRRPMAAAGTYTCRQATVEFRSPRPRGENELGVGGRWAAVRPG